MVKPFGSILMPSDSTCTRYPSERNVADGTNFTVLAGAVSAVHFTTYRWSCSSSCLSAARPAVKSMVTVAPSANVTVLEPVAELSGAVVVFHTVVRAERSIVDLSCIWQP